MSSTPDVTRILVPDTQPGFRLLLASDGLWDAVTVKQASACGAKLGTGPAAAALCKLAQKQKDNRDDITVMVVDILASAEHKDPFQAKPPWGPKLSVLWPFGKKKIEAPPLASERRGVRIAAAEGEARAAAEATANRAAAEAAAAVAAAAAEAERSRVLLQLEEYEAARNTDMGEEGEEGGGVDGWEEVATQHATIPTAYENDHTKRRDNGAGRGAGRGGRADPDRTGRGRGGRGDTNRPTGGRDGGRGGRAGGRGDSRAGKGGRAGRGARGDRGGDAGVLGALAGLEGLNLSALGLGGIPPPPVSGAAAAAVAAAAAAASAAAAADAITASRSRANNGATATKADDANSDGRGGDNGNTNAKGYPNDSEKGNGKKQREKGRGKGRDVNAGKIPAPKILNDQPLYLISCAPNPQI